MARSDFVAGIRAALPLLPGTVPFSTIVGAAAASIGLPAIKATVMSLLFFAGASQLTVIQLLNENAPTLIIVFTALVINVRYMVVSASIAPHFRQFSMGWKLLLSYFLTTAGYVLAITEFESPESVDHRWYYLGVNVPLWVAWQVSFVVGLLLGARVPPGLQLDFAFPLIFMAILFPSLNDRTARATAIIAAIAAFSAVILPFSLELLVATAVGVGGGLILDRRWSGVAS